MLLELLDGIFDERFLKNKKNVDKIKNVINVKKRDRYKKRKKRFFYIYERRSASHPI